MSIFGSMKTAVSGMSAQANRLSTVSDNIANANTTGYKAVSTSFSSLVLPSSSGNYNSGGVQTSVRQAISQQGDISYTTSAYDLAISGDGFFIVESADGTPVLTRAGDFSVDSDGNLVNSAGYTLMGYSYDSGVPAVVVNGFDGLVPVNVSQSGLSAVASSSAYFSGNLNSEATVVTDTTTLPSANTSSVTDDTQKMSLVAYDSLGATVQYDYYLSKIGVTTDSSGAVTGSTWEVAVYRNADATTGGTTSFPYSSDAVSVATLSFDADGQLTSATDTDIVDPATAQTITMDYSDFTQLASDFSATGSADGQAASAVSSVSIGTDGVVSVSYANGTTKSLYQIPLAAVASPDNLTLLSGNVYTANGMSGVTVTGFPQTNGLGSIQSGALESSNVDLAGELTEMIEAQRSYTANSKVFQTGSDIMDVLVNLKR